MKRSAALGNATTPSPLFDWLMLFKSVTKLAIKSKRFLGKEGEERERDYMYTTHVNTISLLTTPNPHPLVL